MFNTLLCGNGYRRFFGMGLKLLPPLEEPSHFFYSFMTCFYSFYR
jgi:hypothetical protein